MWLLDGRSHRRNGSLFRLSFLKKRRKVDLTVVTKFDEFLRLEDQWPVLLDKSKSDYVCMTFQWFKSWWVGFGKDKHLSILLVKEDGGLIGLAPLMISHAKLRGFPIRVVEFIQNRNSPRCDFIIMKKNQEVVKAMVDYLVANKSKWDVIDLLNMPQESDNFSTLENCLRNHGLLFGVKKGLLSPFIPIDSDWRTFFSSRSKKFQKVLRNKVNRMERLGAYNISKIDKESELDGVLNTICKISANSWKARLKEDIAATPENRIFFEELSRNCSNKGWLNIWLLDVDGKAIAYEYHLRYKGRLYGLRADYEEEYGESSPGSVLDMNVVKHAFESGIKEYDLCGSNDFYKNNWTETCRPHVRFLIFNPGPYASLIFFIEFSIIPCLKKLAIFKRFQGKVPHETS